MTERGRDRQLMALAALCGLVTAWIATDPRVLMTLNWDNASYISSYASGQWDWSTRPWNSHFAIGQVYLGGVALARLFGGTYLDGFRLANAVALAIGTALVADTARRLSSRALGLCCALAFLWSWGELQLVCTVEDNVLFVPEAAAVLALCVRRTDAWCARDSVLAGALVAAGVLMSWQAGIYLGPALYVLAVQGGARPWTVRLRDAALLVAALVGALVLWCVLLSLTSTALHASELVDLLFSRPQPSFFPHGMKAWLTLLFEVGDSMNHTGAGVLQELGPPAQGWPVLAGRAVELGAALFVAELAFAAWATWRWIRDRADVVVARLQMLAVTLLALTCVTALYRDLLQDKYKRYEFLPLVLVHVAAALAGHVGRTRPRRLRVAAAVFAVLAVVEVSDGVRWVRAWHERLSDAYYGVDHVSWMGHLRRLRRAYPHACDFVFALDEVKGGQWNHEITAALASELPSYTVVSDRPIGWKKPLRTAPPAVEKLRLRGCEWISPAAATLLR